MTTTRVDVPGGSLVVDDSGSGQPLILIHSATVDRRSWDDVAPLLQAAGYRTVAYDMRGFGESTSQNAAFRGEVDLLAVLDAREVSSAVAIGNSLGAVFALDAALKAPRRFSALIWIGGGIGGFEYPDNEAETEAFAAQQAAADAGDLEAAAEWNVRIWLDGVGQPTSRLPEAIRTHVRQMNRPLVDPEHVFGTLVRPSIPAIDRLDQLEVPMLVIVGALDTSRTRAAAQVLVDRARAESTTMEGTAHLPGVEAPTETAAVILPYLGRLLRWG